MGDMVEGDAGIPVHKLLEALAKQVFRLVAVSWLLAWLLTKSSSYALLNLPVALALICGLRWLALHLDIRVRHSSSPVTPLERRARTHSSRSSSAKAFLRRSFTQNVAIDHDAWRSMVNSKVVEFAWERLCNSIIQEWIYDAWYSTLTADKEFPAEMRLALNSCFGEVCRRARRLDLRQLLVRHVSEVVKSHLELYRRTVYESLGDSYQNIPTAAGRERALLNDLRTTPKDLHVALQTEDGHYKVLKRYSEGIVNKILPVELHAPLLQTLVREIVSTCVLRPIMYYFMPYSVNKLFLSMFDSSPSAVLTPPSASGSQDFDNRARASADQEKLHLEQRAVHLAERNERRRRQRVTSMKHVGEAEHVGKDKAPAPLPTPSAQSLPVSLEETLSTEALTASTAIMSKHTSAWLDVHAPPLPAPQIAAITQLDQTYAHSDSEVMMESESIPPTEGSLAALLTTPPPTHAQHQRSASARSTHGSPPARKLSVLPAEVPGSHWAEAQGAQPGPAALGDQSGEQETGARLGGLTEKGVHGKGHAGDVAATNGMRSGFDGWPRARVVTAMPRQDPTGANKDFVVYQIRVVDNSGEWTVDRRFRNFEALHKKLRDNPKLREQVAAKLPAKRMNFIVTGSNTEFVERRRAELDNYLSCLLLDWSVAVCEEVWEFLRQSSEVYGADIGEGGLIKAFTSNVDLATKSMKKAVGDVFDEGRGRFSKLSSRVGDSATKVGSIKGMLRLTNSPTKSRGTVSMDSSTIPFDLSMGSVSFSRNTEGSEGGRGNLEAQSSSSTQSSPSHMQLQANSAAAAAANDVLPPPNPGPTASPLSRTKSKAKSSKSAGSYPAAIMHTPSRRHSPHKREGAAESASLPPRDQDLDGFAAMELADSSGISAPLYDVIDALFDMQSRGFLRRQVIVSARQLLSLVAGDYIDTFLMSHLHNLRSEHTIARLIFQLQRELWPGGVWFATTKQNTAAPEVPKASSASTLQRPVIQGMQPEKFVDMNYRYGDEEEVAAEVQAKLLSTAPTALVRLIGPKAYQKSTMDLYNMLQSPTFTLMIGYRVLEGVIVALFPELEGVIYAYEATA